VASNEPIKNSTYGNFVNTLSQAFLNFHTIPQAPRKWLEVQQENPSTTRPEAKLFYFQLTAHADSGTRLVFRFPEVDEHLRDTQSAKCVLRMTHGHIDLP
jgi:hypothetical protein